MEHLRRFWNSESSKWGTLIIVLFLSLGIAAHYSYAVFHAEKSAMVYNGEADLRHLEWVDDQTVELNGLWQFTPNALSYSDVDLKHHSIKKIPGLWGSRLFYKHSDIVEKLHLGTYSARIQVSPTYETLALKIQEVRLAAKIYVNGELVYKQDQESSSSVPMFYQRPFVVILPKSVSEYHIFIQVEDPYDFSGGITHPIIMGSAKTLYKDIYLKAAAGIAFSVIFFMLALYLILIFIITKSQTNDATLFTLSVYMFFISVSSLIYGEHAIFYLIGDQWFSFYYRLMVFGFLLVYTLAFIYLWSIETIKIQRRTGRIISGTIILFALSTFIWPDAVLIKIAFPLGLMLFPVFLGFFTWAFLQYMNILKPKALILTHRRALAFQMLIFFFMVFLLLDQFLYTTGWVHKTSIANLAFIGNAVLFSVMVAYRYFASMSKAAELSERLENSLQEKDNFLSETALELKTPLAGIVTVSEGILSSFGTELPSPILQDLTHIHQSGTRLSLLVDELIDLNRMKNGTLALEKTVFDVSVLIANLFEILDHSLIHRDVELIWQREDFPFLVQADENRVSQIIYNLLINAIQNTLEGFIEVIIDYNDHQEIVVMVKDTGTGIPEQALEHIFEPYSRRYRGFKGSEGIGLGLSIAKQLALLSGGDISVTSQVGEGSCFALRLPCAKSETVAELLTHGWAMAELKRESQDKEIASDAFSMEVLSQQNRDAHILVIDDDAAALRVYQRLLNENNMTTLVTTSGKKALEMLERGHVFDAIVLDMMMPEISGFEVLKSIRERNNLYELPVLMITGAAGLLDVNRSFELGANDVIQKPVDGAAFINRIKTLTQLKKYVIEARNSEMAFLQAQIKPHFLFNTLNTIASLCPVDGEAAENLTLELAQFLRTTFDFNHMESYVTLERELEMVTHYLNIEKARFGSKLNFQIDLEPEVNVMVPPLILQPLVENAVKHGVTQKRGGGKIWVKISKAGSEILFVIQDDGVGMSEDRVREVLSKESYRGVGLMNIELRLKGLYNTELLIFSQEGIGTTISFLIPSRFERVN